MIQRSGLGQVQSRVHNYTYKGKYFPFIAVSLITFVNGSPAPEINRERSSAWLCVREAAFPQPSLGPAANNGNNKSIFVLLVFAVIWISLVR